MLFVHDALRDRFACRSSEIGSHEIAAANHLLSTSHTCECVCMCVWSVYTHTHTHQLRDNFVRMNDLSHRRQCEIFCGSLRNFGENWNPFTRRTRATLYTVFCCCAVIWPFMSRWGLCGRPTKPICCVYSANKMYVFSRGGNRSRGLLATIRGNPVHFYFVINPHKKRWGPKPKANKDDVWDSEDLVKRSPIEFDCGDCERQYLLVDRIDRSVPNRRNIRRSSQGTFCAKEKNTNNWSYRFYVSGGILERKKNWTTMRENFSSDNWRNWRITR